MGAPAWMSGRGYDNFEDEQSQAAAESNFGPSRFYLSADKGKNKAEILFTMDDPVRFREHNMKLDGHFRNWTTCTRDNTCPLCAIGDVPYWAVAWVIVDRRKWVDKSGKEHVNEPRMFVTKAAAAGIIAGLSADLKASGNPDGLKGVVVNVSRSSDRASNVGDNFVPKGKVKSESLAKYEADMPDLMTALAPNMARLKSIAAKLKRKTGKEDEPGEGQSDGAAADDDIPFDS